MFKNRMRLIQHGEILWKDYLIAALVACVLGIPAVATAADKVVKVEFTQTPAPVSEAEMVSIYTKSSAIVTYASGARKVFPLSHQVLFRSGDKIGKGEAGLIVDKDGQAIQVSVADALGNAAKGPFHAYAPDANSLIRVQDGKVEKLFLVTQYEYHTEAPLVSGKGTTGLYGRLPMAMNLTTLKQDSKTGRLTAAALSNIDMSGIGGLWIPCAASLTPWNTHLAGEEYEPNARLFENEPLESMNLYLKTPGKLGRDGGANPYRYSHPVEVVVKANGLTEVHKRYAMGRFSVELADVMPDERTAYMGDDGRDGMMFMFVADKARDLSAGSLYAARWEQQSADHGGSANLKWIKLGQAKEADIKALVDRGIGFSDIFEVVSDVAVRVKPGMEAAAAFLESRRYGALLGATSEFTKMEGVTHNAEGRKLYIAMSSIAAGMIDGQDGERPQDHIELKGDPRDLLCGGVYESALSGSQKDTTGETIRSDWVAATMQARVLGVRKPQGQTVGQHDQCDTERMANPDNIKYSPEMRTLFIGEDSGLHLNNFLWAYNIDSGSLTRILSAPAGAEHTGLQVVTNLNGHSYIMSNIQHPGATNDLKQYPDAIKAGLRKKIDQRGRVGYLGGLPALQR